MTDQPWLSVVTVVKDDIAGLTRTLHSLKSQQLKRVEYLVIDSSSNRDEVDALLGSSGFDSPDFSFSYSWVEPQGIYVAMNTGLARVQGTYVYFLNAGDELVPDVLSQVHDASLECQATWLIGQVEVVSVNGSTVVTPEWDYESEQRAKFARGKFAPHQGTFARTEDLRAVGGFDVRFQIAADYSAFLKLTLIRSPRMLGFPIARFYEGGTSSENWRASFIEFHQARLETFNLNALGKSIEYFYTVRQIAAVGIYKGFWSKIFRS
ncbi:MAG: glycosyltransferase [Candidatus Nanopelagicales bacterium]|nr:glycosyltransferase [Candidatus Nanopelagicales bacterium]